jgi:hypothetical protein
VTFGATARRRASYSSQGASAFGTHRDPSVIRAGPVSISLIRASDSSITDAGRAPPRGESGRCCRSLSTRPCRHNGIRGRSRLPVLRHGRSRKADRLPGPRGARWVSNGRPPRLDPGSRGGGEAGKEGGALGPGAIGADLTSTHRHTPTNVSACATIRGRRLLKRHERRAIVRVHKTVATQQGMMQELLTGRTRLV